jgi:hypothetical protein
MAATVQSCAEIPMYIGMSNDFYRPTKIASCAPGLTEYLTIYWFAMLVNEYKLDLRFNSKKFERCKI